MASKTAQIEYMIRVKLPSAGSYHCSPSGDSEYDEAYKRAIFDAKPIGFEVKWPRANEKWAKDSEGRTIVPLFRSSNQDALHSALEEIANLRCWIDRVKKAVSYNI